MRYFLETLNYPAKAFNRHNRVISWSIVAITILVDSVLAPVLDHYFGVGHSDIEVLKVARISFLGMISYLAISSSFCMICKCFGSKRSIMDHIDAWGISFLPTLICAIVVAITEVFFYLFWNNSILGMIVNIIFFAILIWKTILYFIYLKSFAGLKGWKFWGAFMICSIFIILFAISGARLGLITPVI